MSLKALLLSFGGILLLLFGLIYIVPAKGQSPARAAASASFQGQVLGSGLQGKIIEIYINHIEQEQTTRVVMGIDGKDTYAVQIPMENVPDGSTIMFKIDEQVYGIGTLHPGSAQILDLELDEQMR